MQEQQARIRGYFPFVRAADRLFASQLDLAAVHPGKSGKVLGLRSGGPLGE